MQINHSFTKLQECCLKERRNRPIGLPDAKPKGRHAMSNGKENIFVASAWMVGLTLVLFFIPLLNGLIGGAVGGYKAGDWKRAVGAALIPAVIVSVVLAVVISMMNAPILGFFAGMTAFMLVLLADVGILIGAVIGGLFAGSRSHGTGAIA